MTVIASNGLAGVTGSVSGGGSNSGRDFLAVNAPITAAASFTDINVSMQTVTDCTLSIKVLRPTGADYVLVGESQDFSSLSVGANNLVFTTPIDVLVGDVIAFHLAKTTSSDHLQYIPFVAVNGTIWENIDIQGTEAQATIDRVLPDDRVIAFIANGTVSASDTTPPVITLSGDNPLELVVNTTFTEPGFTASDDTDGDITANVTVTGSVDTSTIGSYVLSYNVSDAAGNAATQVQRTVNVVAANNTITITTSPYDFFQRSGANASATVTGTYTGTPTTIERIVNGGAAQTAIASPTGGTFTDTFDLPVGQYTLEYRFSNDVATSDSVTPIGSGLRVAIAGQSNGSGRGSNPQTFNNSAGGITAYLFGNDDQVKQLADPYDSSSGQIDSVSSDSAAGSWIPRFANAWLAENEIPICFIPCAMGGTKIADWSRSTDSATLYGSMYRRILAAGGAELVVWHQGERDSRTTVNTTQIEYRDALVQLAADIKSDFGADTIVVPLHIVTDTGYDNQATIRQAQLDAAAASANITIVEPLTDLDVSGGDGLHFKTDAHLDTIGVRVNTAVAGFLSPLVASNSYTIDSIATAHSVSDITLNPITNPIASVDQIYTLHSVNDLTITPLTNPIASVDQINILHSVDDLTVTAITNPTAVIDSLETLHDVNNLILNPSTLSGDFLPALARMQFTIERL